MLLVGVLLLLGFGVGCGLLVWQLIGRLRSAIGGTAVLGHCVRRYSTEGSDGTTFWHHTYGFTTAEGRYVEFDEDAAFMTVGDEVTIRYRPAAPARSATVMGSGGTWSPLFGQLFGIIITGAFTLLGAMFVWLYLTQ